MWELLARRTGGTASGFAWAPTASGGTDLFAATPAGVLRSGDGGHHWEAPTPRPMPLVAGAVALSPAYAEKGTVVAGGRDGVFRSTDRGQNWRHVLTGTTVFDLVGLTDGVLLAATEADGVLRSEDGGENWQGASAGLLDLTVLTLSFADDRTGFAGAASGLYRTRNGGRAWRAVDLEPEEPAVQALGVSPRFTEDGLVFAGTEADGLFRSGDGGSTWERVAAIEPVGVTAIGTGSHAEQNVVAVAAEGSVLVSTDGGDRWQAVDPLPVPALALAFVPSGGGQCLLAGSAGLGVMRQRTGERTWEPANDGFAAIVTTALRPSPSFGEDGILFALAADGVLGISADRGRSWTERLAAPGQAALGLTVSPSFATDRTLWIETSDGVIVSRDGGERWEPAALGAEPPATQDVDPPIVPFGQDGGPGAVVALARSPAFEHDGLVFAAEPGGAIWLYHAQR